MSLTIKKLGLIPYSECLSLMNALKEERLQNKIGDTLLFLEHPPVITSGRRKSTDDFIENLDSLRDKNIDWVETDRGGKLTYHGPGQLVVYFIINIETLKLSIEQLVRLAEEGLIGLLADYNIKGTRDKINPGVWVEQNKIASLGFHVTKGVTTHGIALNVNNNLTPFSYFIPCGIQNRGVTSMSKEMGRNIEWGEVIEKLIAQYENIFKN